MSAKKKSHTIGVQRPTIWVVAVCLMATLAVVALVWVKRHRGPQVVVERTTPMLPTPTPEAPSIVAPAVYTGEVVDATEDPRAPAAEGRRYIVVIQDEADSGSAGVARIGGMATFVNDADVGEKLLVEVTLVKRTVAEARVVQRLGRVEVARRSPRPATSAPAPSTQIHEGTVDAVGSKGDGIVHLAGKVVFVPGATLGERVRYRIARDGDRFAQGELVEVLTADAAPTAAPPAADQDDTFVATVEDKGARGDGIVRLDGKVVFVAGTEVGQRVRVRVTDDRDRFALGELVEILPPEQAPADTPPAPVAPQQPVVAPPAPPPPAVTPPADTRQQPGAEDVQVGGLFDVEITEKDRRTPDKDGVTRIDGLVVFVPDSQPGERLRIEITERAERFARARKVKSNAGE